MPYQCLNEERRIFFKRSSEKALGDITKIVFDFDGVLVQTLQSCNQNIRKIVDYYFLEILGLQGRSGKLVTLGDIQMFKDTGLYNNDWTLSYAIITYYLAILMRKLQQRGALHDLIEQFKGIQFSEVCSFIQTLREVGEYCKRHGIEATELAKMKNDETLGLKSLLTLVKRQNRPLETILMRSLFQVEGKHQKFIKKLVPYSLEKPDLLKRLFEESYLGKELFKKFYGVAPAFNFDESLLEKEEFIPSIETLHALCSKFGKLAVYSEKPREQAMYLLENSNFKEYFDENGVVFYEDLTSFEKNYRIERDENVQLGKPNPTVLIRMVKKLVGEVSRAMYIGDTIADALLVKNARLQRLSNIVFIGVLCSSRHPDKLLYQYMKQDADAIVTDVNDIPYLYTNLGGDV